jgi:hypothetical protein
MDPKRKRIKKKFFDEEDNPFESFKFKPLEEIIEIEPPVLKRKVEDSEEKKVYKKKIQTESNHRRCYGNEKR